MSRSGHEQPQAERPDFIYLLNHMDHMDHIDRGLGPLVSSTQGPGERPPVRLDHDF